MNRNKTRAVAVCLAVAASTATPAWAATDRPAQAVLAETCIGCHEQNADGSYARINAVRKTPEGWEMTLRRMRQWHQIQVTDGELRNLIKYFADNQGLAPAETAPYRAVLEARPGHVEQADDADIAVFCARCHTYARVALQRRDKDEWRKHVNMHLGQWPTIEYQASGRDREWWKQASTEIVDKLAQKWPYETAEWQEWRGHQAPDLSGAWQLAGHRPGKGDYSGQMTVRRSGPDRYNLSYRLTYADGSTASGRGRSVVYTGYEWRSTATLGKETVHEVYQLAADGRSLKGRWFLDGETAIGGDMTAVRAGAPAVLAVQPPYLKAGQSAHLTIVGASLKGDVDLGPGVAVEKIVAAAPDKITVIARASTNAALGAHAAKVGNAQLPAGLVVYDHIGTLRVEPAQAISRVGGNGGPMATVPTQFEAVAYMAAQPGGGEEVRIGAMPAKWDAKGFDEEAESARDLHFAGRLGPSGLFTPAAAGPNTARGGANNAGNLKITATLTDGSQTVSGDGHLIVTLQRWNDTLIR